MSAAPGIIASIATMKYDKSGKAGVEATSITPVKVAAAIALTPMPSSSVIAGPWEFPLVSQ